MFNLLRVSLAKVKNYSSSYNQLLFSKPIHIALLLIVIAIPLIVNYFLVTVYFDNPITQYTPRWADEILNWHQVATFKAANFNGGYYTVNEIPPAASFLHYYAHGPIYPILYGTLGKIVGWEFYSAPLFNLALITCAIAWFIKVVKPNNLQLLLLALVIVTFWPMHLYMFTNMRQIVDESFAIVFAAFFYKTITEKHSISRLHLAMFSLTIVVAAMFKVSWAFLFFPYLVIIRKQIRLSVIQAIIASFIAVGIIFMVYGRTVAPYPNFTNDLSAALNDSFSQGLKVLLEHIALNVRRFFNLKHNTLWLLLRSQMLLMIGGSFYLLLRKPKNQATVKENIAILGNCGLLFTATILLYDLYVWRDFRLFAPIVLMVLLLLAARKRVVIVALMLLGNLVLLPNFMGTYQSFINKRFPQDRTEIKLFSQQIQPIIKYMAEKNAWDNTLLTTELIAHDRLMLGLPPGIGISYFKSPNELSEIKSRYILLDKDSYEAMKDRFSLEFKLKTSIGDLYINPRK